MSCMNQIQYSIGIKGAHTTAYHQTRANVPRFMFRVGNYFACQPSQGGVCGNKLARLNSSTKKPQYKRMDTKNKHSLAGAAGCCCTVGPTISQCKFRRRTQHQCQQVRPTDHTRNEHKYRRRVARGSRVVCKSAACTFSIIFFTCQTYLQDPHIVSLQIFDINESISYLYKQNRIFCCEVRSNVRVNVGLWVGVCLINCCGLCDKLSYAVYLKTYVHRIYIYIIILLRIRSMSTWKSINHKYLPYNTDLSVRYKGRMGKYVS